MGEKKKAAMHGSGPIPPPCEDHKEVQHRDQQPKWCDSCGWRHEVPAQPPVRLGIPRMKGTVSDAPRTPKIY